MQNCQNGPYLKQTDRKPSQTACNASKKTFTLLEKLYLRDKEVQRVSCSLEHGVRPRPKLCEFLVPFALLDSEEAEALDSPAYIGIPACGHLTQAAEKVPGCSSHVLQSRQPNACHSEQAH